MMLLLIIVIKRPLEEKNIMLYYKHYDNRCILFMLILSEKSLLTQI